MKTDRIFLDANILFSIAYGSSSLSYLWDFAKNGQCELLASRYVIEEAKRNLEDIEQLVNLDSYLTSVNVVSEVDQTLPCPIELPDKDKPVLMAAISAKADYLITGDVTHFGKYFGQKVMGVSIIMARDYILPRIS
jgi:predicted nucleic acid-binding protein